MNFTNNAESKLSTALTSTSLVLTVSSTNNLPTTVPYSLTLQDISGVFEIVTVTAINTIVGATQPLTVTRASEGTTAMAWAVDTLVSNRITADFANASIQNNQPTLINGLSIGVNAIGTDHSVTVGELAKTGAKWSVSIGKGAQANSQEEVALGNNAKTALGFRHSIAIGYDSVTNNEISMAVGRRARAYDYASLALGGWSRSQNRGVSVGYNARAGLNSTERGNIGIGCYAKSFSFRYGISMGYHSVNKAQYGIAIGYRTTGYANSGIAIGTQSSVASPAYSSVVIGHGSTSSAGYSVVLGNKNTVQATALRSNVLGSNCTLSVPDSTTIQNPIIMKKATLTTVPMRDCAATEAVLMTNEIELTRVSFVTLVMPVGTVILISGVGIYCSTYDAGITTLNTQATIEVSTSTDNITFTPIQAATPTVNLTGSRTIDLVPAPPSPIVATHVKVTVTVPATITTALNIATVYKCRAYIKGIVLEE